MLFIDARDYYTEVDRTLNEWSEWQLKNLNAIVWLYRGEVEKYQALLEEYREALHTTAPFAAHLEQLQNELDTLRHQAKEAADNAKRNEKKRVQAAWDAKLAEKNAEVTLAQEAVWLYEKFGDGTYQDIPGLCKVVDQKNILEDKDGSLTPGVYVGTPPAEDDGVDFTERMKEIHQELLTLQDESNRLMETISKNMKEMGL